MKIIKIILVVGGLLCLLTARAGNPDSLCVNIGSTEREMHSFHESDWILNQEKISNNEYIITFLNDTYSDKYIIIYVIKNHKVNNLTIYRDESITRSISKIN